MASSAVLHRRVGLATIFLEISCFDLTPAKILELERAKFGLPIRMPSTSSKRTGPLRVMGERRVLFHPGTYIMQLCSHHYSMMMLVVDKIFFFIIIIVNL